MKTFPKSIKGRLFLWFFTFTSVLLIAVGLTLYYKAKVVIFDSVDNMLHSKAQIISGLLHVERGEIELELTEIESPEYSFPLSGHYYKMFMDGELFAASPSLIDKGFDLTSGNPESYREKLGDKIYTSIGPDKEPIRVIQHDFEFLDLPATIFAAESLEDSIDMLSRLRWFLIIIIPASISIVGIGGFRIAKHSLKPIQAFSFKISRINHKNLSERVDAETDAQELSRLALSFNKMLDRLQQAFEAEKRMISDASHELKTPLSVINSHCDVILQKERTKDEYIEALNTIKITTEGMTGLIRNMLSLARLDSGIVASDDFKKISLNDCLWNVVHLSEVSAENKHINIKTLIKEEINIQGNKESIIEAFLNIVENAIKYSKEGGIVEISTIRNDSNDSLVNISIKDTGIGIKKNNLDEIFERFYRVDSSRSTDGTGLGLSIAKAIIEAHDGNITVKSALNKGSCFSITLPLNLSTELS